MFPVTSPSPKYWTSTLPSFLSVLLVLAVHGRAGVDDVAQRRVVVRVHRRMLGQHLDDRRDGEHVRDAPARDQPKPRRCRTDRLRAAPSSRPGPLRELMDACAVGQRRNHQGRIRLRGARHQVAEVVRDNERHLPMGEDGGLGPTRRAG